MYYNDCFEVTGHGGNCCGINHLYEFPDLDDAGGKEERKAMIAAFIYALQSIGSDLRNIVEVVLTDEQLRSGWLRVVQRNGFKRVSRFKNSNSGNVCNIFHRYGGDPVPSYKGRKK